MVEQAEILPLISTVLYIPNAQSRQKLCTKLWYFFPTFWSYSFLHFVYCPSTHYLRKKTFEEYIYIYICIYLNIYLIPFQQVSFSTCILGKSVHRDPKCSAQSLVLQEM